MNEIDPQALLQGTSNIGTAVSNMIKKTCIIDYGVILEVLAEGVVKVGISVANSPNNVQIITCTLVSFCSDSFAIKAVPKVKDKVIVLYPRLSNQEMFDKDRDEVIYDPKAKGYNTLCGLALLYNQYRNKYKNVITVDNGNLTIDNTKARVEINNNGNISIDAKGGKIQLKNNSENLKDILDGILNKLNSSYRASGIDSSGDTVTTTPIPNQLLSEKESVDNLLM